MGDLTPEQIRRSMDDLLERRVAMTLATAGPQGPWAAPVYYVYHRFALYFFSSPASRHIQQALLSGQCAAAVFEDSATWEGICGIQMAGTVEEVTLGREMAGALSRYLQKYPFVKGFFPGGEMSIYNLFDKFRVRLYRFAPSTAFYSDNRIRFGFREQVDWSGGPEGFSGLNDGREEDDRRNGSSGGGKTAEEP